MNIDFDDRIRDKCGIFGVFGHKDASALTALGLHALQHRGQESAGIVSFDGKNFNNQLYLGLVGDYFTKENVIKKQNFVSFFPHKNPHLWIIQRRNFGRHYRRKCNIFMGILRYSN